MINNDLRNADETRSNGNGIGRFFVAQSHFGSMRNMYWGGNTSHNAAPRDCNAVDCNKESKFALKMYSEGGLRTDFLSATASTISFSGNVNTSTQGGGVDVVIVGGRGAGQRRNIISASGGVVTLERPWNVIPDSTSKIVIAATASQAAIYKNTFEGRATYHDHDSDSTAVLLYGNVQDMVVDSNNISQMRHGMMTVALTSADGMSAYFLQYSNNTVKNSNSGLYVGSTFVNENSAGVWGGLGNVYRKNNFSNLAHIGVEYEMWDYSGADHNGAVFESNTFTNLPFGFINAYHVMWTYTGNFLTPPSASSRMYNTILYNNTFNRGTASVPGGTIGFKSTQPLNTWLNMGTTWMGFDSGNTGP